MGVANVRSGGFAGVRTIDRKGAAQYPFFVRCDRQLTDVEHSTFLLDFKKKSNNGLKGALPFAIHGKLKEGTMLDLLFDIAAEEGDAVLPGHVFDVDQHIGRDIFCGGVGGQRLALIPQARFPLAGLRDQPFGRGHALIEGDLVLTQRLQVSNFGNRDHVGDAEQQDDGGNPKQDEIA